ncbi:PDR/VanB family oxidoreductase [Rhodococcus sp. ACS1]|uniref:PDR/VanB family oxidoreductase n=1 Tax=Rhodococcus sp. ACS1 TaxID=2028570 RepID=UPI00211C1C90|nr:PDR/VanB family oxidoreductase [Rhodococcus sp. ACS1]
MKVNVLSTEGVTAHVVALTLEPTANTPLPAWQPGAHIDLELPSGLVRQYSLCGSPHDEKTYTVAVLREPNGRGGSAEVHDTLTPGTQLTIRGPRNHFPLVESNRYLFIAGGIGVTPMLPMIETAERNRADWTLIYGGRTLTSMAYLDRLLEFGPDRVTPVAEDVSGRPDLGALLSQIGTDTQIYCCGPSGLLDAVEAECSSRGLAGQLHIERFAAPANTVTGPVDGDLPFEVHLQQSGVTVQVGADQTILDALEDTDVEAPFSCEEGFCGACEVRVLGGVPDHRDSVSPAADHDAAKTMIICVGRSKSPRLVLDL